MKTLTISYLVLFMFIIIHPDDKKVMNNLIVI
jgi:hypothetical protein